MSRKYFAHEVVEFMEVYGSLKSTIQGVRDRDLQECVAFEGFVGVYNEKVPMELRDQLKRDLGNLDELEVISGEVINDFKGGRR